MADALFTSPRTTTPDWAALLVNLRTAVNDPAAVFVWRGADYRVQKATAFTAPELAAAQTAIDTAPAQTAQLTYTSTSRGKDILTTLAMIVRAKNLAAWNAMTVQQKKDATFAEADVWVTIRDFVEQNL
jgi:deferrochelatase/peroxidase EfeB